MTDGDYKTLLENPTQDEIEAAGREYYGDISSKPAKVVKAGKYIALLRMKTVFQKNQLAERDAEITSLNERVRELHVQLGQLYVAMDDLLLSPKGVVPERAAPFYAGPIGGFRAALNTKDG